MAGETAPRGNEPFDRDAIVTASRGTGRLLRAASAARTRAGLAAEDLLIFLAVGHLGIDASGEIPRMTPCTYLQIAELLSVPRETVRRKVGRLCDRGFTRIDRAGVVVRDVGTWLRQAAALIGDGSSPADGVDVAELRQRVK